MSKITLHLDSTNRTNTAVNPNTSTFSLQREILSMQRSRLRNIVIPFDKVYNITAANQRLDIDDSLVGGPFTLTVPEGNYSMEALALELTLLANIALNTAGSTVRLEFTAGGTHFFVAETSGTGNGSLVFATSTIAGIIGLTGNLAIPSGTTVLLQANFISHLYRNIYILTNFKNTDAKDFVFDRSVNANVLNTAYIFGVIPLTFGASEPESKILNYLSNGEMIYQTYEDDYHQFNDLSIELWTFNIATQTYILLPLADVNSNYSIEFEITTRQGF